MTRILEVDAQALITTAAQELKKDNAVKPPAWSKFVKTCHFKERLPSNDDWWYVRSASILRIIAKLGPVGTQKLRTKYGGRKNRGYKPEATYKGSGSIIRKVFQPLEKSGLIKQTQKGVHKGRVLTPKGTSFLDKIATSMSKAETKE